MANAFIDPAKIGDIVQDKIVDRYRHPLTHFKGKLVKVKGEERRTKKDEPLLWVIMVFSNLEVIEARQPYAEKTTEIQFPYLTDFSTSGISILINSLIDLVGRTTSLNEWVDKQWELKFVDGCPDRVKNDNTGKWEDSTKEAWIVAGLQGVADAREPGSGGNTSGGAVTDDTIVEFLNGKNKNTLGKWLLTEPGVPSELNEMAMNDTEGQIIDRLEEEGKITVSEDGTVTAS